MITLNQTAGTNNETIWLIKINTASPVYLSTKDITLDSTFDGQVLNYDNYLSDINFGSNVRESGGTGEVTSFTFSISRYVSNSAFSSFFNEFYPATSGVYLSSVLVQLGIVWEGATTDAEITWLMAGRIVDYNYEQRRLNLTVFQESEITNKEVPYYSVQKDFDNEMSYYLFAPEDSYGVTIPIAYGDLTLGMPVLGAISTRLDFANLSPCVRINKNKGGYAVTSHKCYYTVGGDVLWSTTDAVIFYYLRGISTYMAVFNRDATADSETNDNTKHNLFLQQTRGLENLKGFCRIKLTGLSKYSDIDIYNIIDRDTSNYEEIDNNEVCALRIEGDCSTGEIGIPSNLASSDVQIVFDCSNDGAGTYNIEVTYKNTPLATPDGAVGYTSVDVETAIGYEIGTITTAKKDAESWTIEELIGLDYLLTNKSGVAGNDVRVYFAYIQLDNIFVQTRNQARLVRNDGNGRGG